MIATVLGLLTMAWVSGPPRCPLFVRGEQSKAAAERKKPHVVFVTGDCEYRSEVSMPMIAKILEAKHGMRCSLAYAVNENTDKREPNYLKNIEGLEALKTADLAVVFIRYRQLPERQLNLILDYVNSGRPIVGLRTSTHAFRYLDGPQKKWNDGFGRAVFGQKWIRHHGHDSSTNVYVSVQDHPITRGLAPYFHCRSWLYHVVPLHGDCRPLLVGAAVKGEEPSEEIFGIPSPVAWTKTYKGARVFFTTLGHPKDFENVKSLWKAFMPRMVTVYMDQLSEHQRDLTNSASMRFFTELVTMTFYAAHRLRKGLQDCEMNTEALARHFDESSQWTIAEPLYIALALSGHADPYETVHSLSTKARERGVTLLSLLNAEAKELLSELSPELREIVLSPSRYLGDAPSRSRLVCDHWENTLRTGAHMKPLERPSDTTLILR